MEKITLEFIHPAVLGSIVNQGAINEITKITTDTRKIVPGGLRHYTPSKLRQRMNLPSFG